MGLYWWNLFTLPVCFSHLLRLTPSCQVVSFGLDFLVILLRAILTTDVCLGLDWKSSVRKWYIGLGLSPAHGFDVVTHLRADPPRHDSSDVSLGAMATAPSESPSPPGIAAVSTAMVGRFPLIASTLLVMLNARICDSLAFDAWSLGVILDSVEVAMYRHVSNCENHSLGHGGVGLRACFELILLVTFVEE
ncbi:hypothetical protein B0H10DRAFT_2201348 [Mycena sp. CBHHK59/15]|nr:hypothetical protein B0H10DRAFT_2201348 [Mycena sp. CBHHK59/15]